MHLISVYQAFEKNSCSFCEKSENFLTLAEFLLVAIKAGIAFFSASIRNVDQVEERSLTGLDWLHGPLLTAAFRQIHGILPSIRESHSFQKKRRL